MFPPTVLLALIIAATAVITQSHADYVPGTDAYTEVPGGAMTVWRSNHFFATHLYCAHGESEIPNSEHNIVTSGKNPIEVIFTPFRGDSAVQDLQCVLDRLVRSEHSYDVKGFFWLEIDAHLTAWGNDIMANRQILKQLCEAFYDHMASNKAKYSGQPLKLGIRTDKQSWDHLIDGKTFKFLPPGTPITPLWYKGDNKPDFRDFKAVGVGPWNSAYRKQLGRHGPGHLLVDYLKERKVPASIHSIGASALPDLGVVPVPERKLKQSASTKPKYREPLPPQRMSGLSLEGP